MEPELAQQLGLVPPEGGGLPPPDLPSGAGEFPTRPSGGGLLEEQRLWREEGNADPSASAQAPAPDLTARIEALERENATLKQGSDPASQAQSFLAQRQNEITMQADLALQQLRAGPVAQGQLSEEYAQALVQMARTAAEAEARAKASEMALGPAASRVVADRIAQEFSLPNVTITADDLVSESTVEGMRARARTMQELRRNQSFATRVAKGTDAAESAGGQGSIDPRLLDRLSAPAMIKLGILRNHTG